MGTRKKICFNVRLIIKSGGIKIKVNKLNEIRLYSQKTTSN